MGTLKFAAHRGASARTLTLRTTTGMQPLTRTDIPATRPNGLTSHPGSTQTVFGERSIYRRGEPITDTSTDFLRVERGVVALYRLMPGRRSICVGLLGPGDVLRVPHASDVRADALTDVQVLGLDHRRWSDSSRRHRCWPNKSWPA